MAEHPDREMERRVLVADEIRSWMGRRRCTQAALAGAIGRSEMYVSRALRGLRPFSTDDLFKIADTLAVPADVLLHVHRDGDAVNGRHVSPVTGHLPVSGGSRLSRSARPARGSQRSDRGTRRGETTRDSTRTIHAIGAAA